MSYASTRTASSGNERSSTLKFNEEDFAIQMEYVARLGKMVAPGALSFLDDTILFTGEDPFSSEELAALLPDQVECYDDYEVPDGVRFSIVVVGQTEFSEEKIQHVLATSGDTPPAFLPQEGFLDQLLFGHRWWDTDVEWLNKVLAYHPGLQYVKSLVTFSWPGTEAQESSDVGVSEAEYQPATQLYEVGYKITGLSRSERWRILKDKAVPALGLEEVAGTIASHCRTRKRQRGGRERYAHAIAEWEYDLARLKREIYDSGPSRFYWPRAEP